MIVEAEAMLPVAVVEDERISFEEYLVRYNSYEGGKTEWVAGKVEISMSNNLQHNEVIGFLYRLLDALLDLKNLGRAILAGLPMYVGEDKPAREPDILVVFNEHSERITPKYLDGPADIVVEVVSPESDARDHGTKLVEYEEAGVSEYWLFDPLREDAVILALKDGRYRRVERDAQGRLISTLLPGFALDPEILWRELLPKGAETFKMAQAMVQNDQAAPKPEGTKDTDE
jgi:Uma2 family endonuclease